VALPLKLKSSVPALFVLTVPIVVPPTVRLPPWVKAPSVPLAEKMSGALAPPFLVRVSVAPLKLFAAESSASETVTLLSSSTAALSSV